MSVFSSVSCFRISKLSSCGNSLATIGLNFISLVSWSHKWMVVIVLIILFKKPKLDEFLSWLFKNLCQKLAMLHLSSGFERNKRYRSGSGFKSHERNHLSVCIDCGCVQCRLLVGHFQSGFFRLFCC